MLTPTPRPPGVGEYEEKLKLCWPVTYWLAPGEEMCRILSCPENKTHEIRLTEIAVRQSDLVLADVVHELCHAALAERIDPAFSTVWFSQKYTRRKDEGFMRQGRMLYLAWALVDLWVNDLRHEIWPELTLRDHAILAQGLTIMTEVAPDRLGEPEILLGIAQYQAERERLGLEESPDAFAILAANNIKVDKSVRRLARFFRDLPRLSGEPEQDLKVLIESVREVARRLGFKIYPRLVLEGRFWRWEV